MPKSYPEIIVSAIILNDNHEVLLLNSFKTFNKLTLPGGHLELGESLISGVKREVYEETGLTPKNFKLYKFVEFIYGKSFWKEKHFIFFYYTCRSKKQKVLLNEEHQDFVWYPLSSIKDSTGIDPSAQSILEQYINEEVTDIS
ncbi:NUDIX domain-containing protein [Desulfosediminicola ganghwensis]|uniref:NUDIX domain-containing protein n=1 Tax=Desulfosediminicola ganghwensis TaxID=2569540 RepID=UPI0010ABCBFF|nr:NUDIX domain-containing protein [Desulfosediminicola ganghwensis]